METTMKQRKSMAGYFRHIAESLENPMLVVGIEILKWGGGQEVIDVSSGHDCYPKFMGVGPKVTDINMKIYNSGKIKLHDCAECGESVNLNTIKLLDGSIKYGVSCPSEKCSTGGFVVVDGEPVAAGKIWNERQKRREQEKQQKEFFKTHPRYCPVCGDKMGCNEWSDWGGEDWVCSNEDCSYVFDEDYPSIFDE